MHEEAEHAVAAHVAEQTHLHARLADGRRHVGLEMRRPGQHTHVHASRRRVRALLLRVRRVLEARRSDCNGESDYEYFNAPLPFIQPTRTKVHTRMYSCKALF